MKLTLFVLLAFLTLNLKVGFADSISSVSCATPTEPLATGIASCSALGNFGYAKATANAAIDMPTDPSQAWLIDVSNSASTLLGGVRGITALSTATSSNSIAIGFDTQGPVETGFLEVSISQNGFSHPVNGSASETLQVGSYSFVSNDGTLQSVFVPIELGTDFNFSFVDSLLVNGDAATGATGGSIGADISLQAFEADKTTPVALFDPSGASATAPEPGSLGLVLIALLGAGFIIRRRFSAS